MLECTSHDLQFFVELAFRLECICLQKMCSIAICSFGWRHGWHDHGIVVGCVRVWREGCLPVQRDEQVVGLRVHPRAERDLHVDHGEGTVNLVLDPCRKSGCRMITEETEGDSKIIDGAAHGFRGRAGDVQPSDSIGGADAELKGNQNARQRHVGLWQGCWKGEARSYG